MGILKTNLSTKLIIGLVIVLLAWIIILFDFGPPKPLITSEGKEITTVQGAYCWDTIVKNECVDKIPPVEIVANNGIVPISVSPQSKIEIRFKSPPIYKIEVAKWTSSDESEEMKIEDDAFAAPKDEGVYIYSVSGIWDEGSSSSVFVIEVE